MEYLERRVGLVNSRLESILESTDPDELSEQLEDVVLAGGKRVRPAVTLLACESLGGDPEDAVDFAAGIEFVHNASLVIDDIIDRSEVRRGTPSAWAAHGYGPAIIASDGLLGEAFGLFLGNEQATEIVAESMVELGEGEATELVDRPSNEDEYMTLARRKTGALFRAAAELGAVAGDADAATIEAFGEYAERVGVAFQIRDDVLDATADADALGKPAGHDEMMDRPSLVQVTDLTPAEGDQRAREQSELALKALDRTGVDDTDAKAYLRDLAEFVVVREK